MVCYHTPRIGEPFLRPLVIHATADEFPELALPCLEAFKSYPERKSVITGEITNVGPDAGTLMVWVGGSGVEAGALTGYDFRLSLIADGLHDVMVLGFDASKSVTRLAIEHGAEVNGTGHVTIDWNGSVAVEPFDLSVLGVTPGETLSLQSGLETGRGAFVRFSDAYLDAEATEYVTTFNAAPAAVLASGDMQNLQAISIYGVGLSRVVSRNYFEAEDMEVTFPSGEPQLKDTPMVSGPYPRHRITWNDVGANLTNAYFSYDTAQLKMGWDVFITAGWLTEKAYTSPDLGALAGWDAAWNVSAADITDSHNYFRAYFDPTEQALYSNLGGRAPQEGESSYLQSVF